MALVTANWVISLYQEEDAPGRMCAHTLHSIAFRPHKTGGPYSLQECWASRSPISGLGVLHVIEVPTAATAGPDKKTDGERTGLTFNSRGEGCRCSPPA